MALEHENKSNSLVAEEFYQLLQFEPCEHIVGITYETDPILRKLILCGTGFLYRELDSHSKMNIVLGSAEKGFEKHFIRWTAHELDSEGHFVEEHSSQVLPMNER